MSKDHYTPEELDNATDKVAGFVKVSILIMSNAIAEDVAVWQTALATDDKLREHVKTFINLLTEDLKLAEEVRLKLSDWL